MIAPTGLVTREGVIGMDRIDDILRDELATKQAIKELVSEVQGELCRNGIRKPSKQSVATRLYNRMVESGWPELFASGMRDSVLQNGCGAPMFCNWHETLEDLVKPQEPKPDDREHATEPEPQEPAPNATATEAKKKAERQVAVERHLEAVKQSDFRRWVTVLYKEPIARKLKMNGCGLVTCLMNYQIGREYVYVNMTTLRKRFKADKEAIRGRIGEAMNLGILSRWRIERLSSEDREYLKECGIYKETGWLYRVNPPEIWNWQIVGGIPDPVKPYLHDDNPTEDSDEDL